MNNNGKVFDLGDPTNALLNAAVSMGRYAMSTGKEYRSIVKDQDLSKTLKHLDMLTQLSEYMIIRQGIPLAVALSFNQHMCLMSNILLSDKELMRTINESGENQLR